MLNYNPNTGDIVWTLRKTRWGVRPCETPAGHIDKQTGYIRISVNRRNYYAHRLAFFLMTGSWPQGQVDHINGDTTDNRWDNLRDIPREENQRNMSRAKNNSSGVTGVYFETRSARWVAETIFNGEKKRHGSHKDWFEAVCARKSAERRLGFHKNHGKPPGEERANIRSATPMGFAKAVFEANGEGL